LKIVEANVMKSDSIEHILQKADAKFTEDHRPDANAMATVVLEARRRRQHRRFAVRALAVVLVLMGAAVWMLQPRPSGQIPAGLTSFPPPHDYAREIEITEQNLRLMIAAERLTQAEARLTELSRIPTPKDVTERAAQALLTQADRLAQAGGLTASAERAYGEVIAHLPETSSARIARQRIAELRKEG
jgi:hypothetical protein